MGRMDTSSLTRHQESAGASTVEADYSYVNTVARIATYDDLRSAPRITEIQPAETSQFIEKLASTIYDQAKTAGGTIPYTVIREVTENFIHAQFNEIVVSILQHGNAIRFADQGPGIPDKDKAQRPGFTSAIEPMKHYIRGVGSGLPIVKDYLDFSRGTIQIEDNLGTGAVVTISVSDYNDAPSPLAVNHTIADQTSPSPSFSTHQTSKISPLIPPLTQHGRTILPLLLKENILGVTDIKNLTGLAESSIYSTLVRLEEDGLVKKVGKKRTLTDIGADVAQKLL